MNLRAHAKINLNLTVRGIRPDGYHELKTVFQSLALHDTLRFDQADEEFSIVCASPDIPLDERNLVWKAARLVWGAAGRNGEPVGRVRITKRIPAQSGLGGGSADGAAALVGWNRLWDTRLPAGQLRELAVRLGADVPFFLCAGTALGLNCGDEIYPLVDGPARWVVLVFPPFGVATPEAFQWWDADCGPVAVPGAGKLPPASDPLAVFNDLERPVSGRHPQLVEIREQLERAGADAAAMTGSGSTVFGLFETKEAATTACDRMGQAGWRSMVTRTATRRQAGLGPGR
ncbi:MAG TPA: 4-(cytidine 5'-diphospho)-2-C-methyl-D-erythritol kinase [Vicinamibacterales bacterium]